MRQDSTLYAGFLATKAAVCVTHHRTIPHLLHKLGGRCNETRKSKFKSVKTKAVMTLYCRPFIFFVDDMTSCPKKESFCAQNFEVASL